MTIKRFRRAASVAAGLALMTLSPAFAAVQDRPGVDTSRPGDERITGERVQPGRTGAERNQRNQRQRNQRPQAPAPVDPAVVKAEVEAVFATASTPCQVTDAKLLGVSAEQTKIYEAACDGGPGYIVVASTPPQLADCVVLHSQAENARAANPEAPPSQTCSLPANQDVMGVMKAYAVQAQVPCNVDEAKVRGQSNAGAVIYEIGCVGVDGYWIEKNASGWEKTECLQILSQNATCLLTTPAEQAATVKSWLAGSDAAACDVQQTRLMGQNANGRFYEFTCAGADGYIIRVNDEKQVQQTYPCATAQQIGGGCKLTTAAPQPGA